MTSSSFTLATLARIGLKERSKIPGRPPIQPGEDTKMIGFKAALSTRTRIETAGKRLGLNKSEVIRAAVLAYLTAFEKTLPTRATS